MLKTQGLTLQRYWCISLKMELEEQQLWTEKNKLFKHLDGKTCNDMGWGQCRFRVEIKVQIWKIITVTDVLPLKYNIAVLPKILQLKLHEMLQYKFQKHEDTF